MQVILDEERVSPSSITLLFVFQSGVALFDCSCEYPPSGSQDSTPFSSPTCWFCVCAFLFSPVLGSHWVVRWGGGEGHATCWGDFVVVLFFQIKTPNVLAFAKFAHQMAGQFSYCRTCICCFCHSRTAWQFLVLKRIAPAKSASVGSWRKKWQRQNAALPLCADWLFRWACAVVFNKKQSSQDPDPHVGLQCIYTFWFCYYFL